MWSSRSAWRSCWPASGSRCAGRCGPRPASRRVKVGPLTIDLSARAVLLNGSRLTLTPKEYRLLQVLAQHAGNVVTHQHLLREVWGSVHEHDTHYLRIFVRKLRQKIEPEPNSPRILLTELGVGYRLAGENDQNGFGEAARADTHVKGPLMAASLT